MFFKPPDSPYGVYHSVYDSFEWMDTEGDPGFKFHVAMAQLWGLVALRLAGSGSGSAPVPFNMTLQAEAIRGYIDAAKQRPNGTRDRATRARAHTPCTQLSVHPVHGAHP